MIFKNISLLEGQPREAAFFFKRGILDQFCHLPVWIAGGALRKFINQEDHLVSDVDLFFGTQQAFDEVKQSLLDQGYEFKYETDNALNLVKDDISLDLV